PTSAAPPRPFAGSAPSPTRARSATAGGGRHTAGATRPRASPSPISRTAACPPPGTAGAWTSSATPSTPPSTSRAEARLGGPREGVLEARAVLGHEALPVDDEVVQQPAAARAVHAELEAGRRPAAAGHPGCAPPRR